MRDCSNHGDRFVEGYASGSLLNYAILGHFKAAGKDNLRHVIKTHPETRLH
jgi:hypothetical protein